MTALGMKRDGPRKPMPRPTKPIRRRNQQRNPGARASAQREACMERDGGRCAFEILAPDWLVNGAFGESWMRCGRTRSPDGRPLQAAHVWRKPQIGHRATIDHPDVVIAACVPHHQQWDDPSRRDGLRIPAEAVDRARARINLHRAQTKKLPLLPKDAQP